MVEDLSKMWGKLSLNEGETMEVEIQPRSVEGMFSLGKFCVVGKLLTDRFVGKRRHQTNVDQRMASKWESILQSLRR
jgi:hypothetical protein